jgi:hypothetical protein
VRVVWLVVVGRPPGRLSDARRNAALDNIGHPCLV